MVVLFKSMLSIKAAEFLETHVGLSIRGKRDSSVTRVEIMRVIAVVWTEINFLYISHSGFS